jgi:hypothetical protein
MTRIALLLLTLLLTPALTGAQEAPPVPSPIDPADQGEDAPINVNTRYTVESVRVRGIDESQISDALRDDLHALAGERLNNDHLDRLTRRLKEDLADYDVSHYISRGEEPGRLRVVFRFKRSAESRWIQFKPTPSKLVHHGDQGWSGLFQIAAGRNSGRLTLGLVRGNNDDLIEEHSGFLARVESREAGTKRLGFSLEVSRLSQNWRPETLAALQADADSPSPYGRRLTFEPMVTVALARHLTFAGGISASDLTSPTGSASSERANAVVAGVGYNQRWDRGTRDHHLDASYQLRKATTSLDSAVVYERHIAQARYRIDDGRGSFIASALFGKITGHAPLFERFALGDTNTLRGWNKFDLVPAGTNRVAYQSVEYRYRGFAYFLDAGAVWSAGDEIRTRLSTGVGFNFNHAFLIVGVPLNAPTLSGTVMFGVRF